MTQNPLMLLVENLLNIVVALVSTCCNPYRVGMKLATLSGGVNRERPIRSSLHAQFLQGMRKEEGGEKERLVRSIEHLCVRTMKEERSLEPDPPCCRYRRISLFSVVMAAAATLRFNSCLHPSIHCFILRPSWGVFFVEGCNQDSDT